MQRGIIETILGIIVLATALFFGVTIWQSSFNAAHQYDYHIKVDFDRIDGLATGADVKIGGVKIGYVHDIAIDPEFYNVILDLRLDKALKIPNDSRAAIAADGLLSDKFVALNIGSAKEYVAHQGRLEQSEAVVSFEELIARALFLLTNDG